MGFTSLQYREMLATLERNSHRSPATDDAVTNEKGLHVEIMAWCDKQWPRIKYIHARMDRKSTIAVGAHDLTLFMPGGKVLCIECKAKAGKLSNEQLAWTAEMRLNGHEVWVVRSMGEFEGLVRGNDRTDAQPTP
jgi:hypothetical protein